MDLPVDPLLNPDDNTLLVVGRNAVDGILDLGEVASRFVLGDNDSLPPWLQVEQLICGITPTS